MNLKIFFNSTLYFLFILFPLLIIFGSGLLNLFSVIFSFYAIVNFKLILKLILSKRKIFIYLIFSLLAVFPYNNLNISLDFQSSFWKSIFFLRFILMTFGIIIFFSKSQLFELKFKNYYLFFLIIISIDVINEYFTGTNFFGNSTEYTGRISSFTNTELIIGYIFCFLSLFCFDKLLNINKKFYIIILLLFILLISFIIGERSNFLKLFFLLLFSYSFIYLRENNFKPLNFLKSIIVLLICSILFIIAVKNTKQASKMFIKIEKISNFQNIINNSKHTPHYATALKIFYNNPIFGIGINNFEKESKKKIYSEKKYKYNENRSSTHPHQIYFEMLSEIGLIGTLYFLILFIWSIYLSVNNYLKENNIQIFSHFILNLFFIFPILPSGSFFGTVYGLPFWFNFAILIYISQKKEIDNELKN
tara:strand:+ start:4375 stop:5631 length:1257 start_codon:yes stop_codon:yes gene_type:complete